MGEAGAFRVLRERIDGAGLLRRRPWYYGLKIGFTVIGFLLAWIAFFQVGDSWLTLGVAAVLAFMSTQVVFLGHDAGHRQISRSRSVNRLIGLVAGNALTGLSFSWWVPKHNAHHAYPNQVGRDPDLGGGIIAFSTTTGAASNQQGTPSVRARLERWAFAVVLLLQGIGLHVSSVQSVLRRRDHSTVADGVLLVGNAVVYLAAVFWVLSPVKALVFIAVHQGLFGFYLGCTFAPNHKGMRILEHDASLSFLERQVTTARNVRGGKLVSLLYGGLNYQIEHHLFPAMPRPNLARAQAIVQAFCVEHGLAYCQAGMLASYRHAFFGIEPARSLA